MVVVTTVWPDSQAAVTSGQCVVEVGNGGLGERALDFGTAIGRQVRQALRQHRGGAVVALPSWPLGRLLRQSTPWRERRSPLAPASATARAWTGGRTHGRHRLAQRARCSAFQVMATGTTSPNEYRHHAELHSPELAVETTAYVREAA